MSVTPIVKFVRGKKSSRDDIFETLHRFRRQKARLLAGPRSHLLRRAAKRQRLLKAVVEVYAPYPRLRLEDKVIAVAGIREELRAG
jgi:hypothetical protein